jgi:hypothetical protein
MSAPRTVPWHPVTLIAFRFSALYFGLYVLTTQMLGALLPLRLARFLDVGRLVSPYVSAVGRWLFGVEVAPTMSGSGDKLYDWIHVPAILLVALAGTMAWSILHRTRPAHYRVHGWAHVFLRFALGATLISYGSVKALPMQMPAPPLTRLLEPFGNFSPMGVLWYSIGSSFPYESFTGFVELAAGILLFIPRTATLGALVALAATTQVFVLNMTYDVPVKLFSFHLVLMSLWLLAPVLGRLAAAVFATGARTRASALAQVAFGTWIAATAGYGAAQAWHVRGGGAPKPPLYGIWTVDTMRIDGVERAPLVIDRDRWRRVVIQAPTTIVFWQMDDTPLVYVATYDHEARTIALRRNNAEAGSLRFEHPDPERLTFAGTVEGRAIEMHTTRVDHTKFLLLSRGFNWVQEFPFNR